jgi:hypothetical protein
VCFSESTNFILALRQPCNKIFLLRGTLSFNVTDDQSTKAELLQLKLTPIICVMNFIDKKVGNQKTKPT